MPAQLDSRPLMSPSRPMTPASQRELDSELVADTAASLTRRRCDAKGLASHLAAFVAGALFLALLLLLLQPPPPSPSSVPLPSSTIFSFSFLSPRRALEELCEVPRKRLLEARSGRGYFAELDAAAAALPPALHATLLLGGAGGISDSSSESSSSPGNGRLVFVGDVHGCAVDLEALLRKIDFQAAGKDTLVFLGDLVCKGPDSPRVLRLARELGALAVRGNHDDAALAAYDFSRRHGGALPQLSSESATGGEDFSFVRNLTEKDARFLREMPWTLEVPALRAVAVHAGLVPGVAVDDQRPSDVFTMRGVVEVEDENDDDDDSFIVRGWRWLLRSLFHKRSSERQGEEQHGSKEEEVDTGRRGGAKAQKKANKKREEKRKVSYRATAAVGEGEPWARAWSSFRGQSRHALFGHDARGGIQLERWATGLDSGCVLGGELTALVLPIPTSSSSSLSSSSTKEESQNRLPKNKQQQQQQQQPRGRWPAEGVELVSVKCRGAARKGESHWQ